MSETPVFKGFSKDAITFLQDLRTHNDRAWFAEHKTVYEGEIKRPAAAFSALMTAALEAMTARPHGYKIFRIHRDVRFSKDKTPYNTHLHIAFMPSLDMPSPPCWFFGLDPDRLTLGTGVFTFDKAALESFRTRVLGAEGADLENLLADLEGQGVRLGEPDLKRVPAGYPKDHPQATLLRHKGLSAWIDNSNPAAATDETLVDRCTAEFQRLKPVYDFLCDGSKAE